MAVLAVAGASATANAQGNFQSQPLGGISALMGGTGVALGTDAAAPLLNPAAIARINRSALAIGSQLVEITHHAIDDLRGPDAIEDPATVTALSVRFIPSTVCFFHAFGADLERVGTHTVSFCVAAIEDARTSFRTPSEPIEPGDTSFGAGIVRGFWGRQDFAATWGTHLFDQLAVGASFVVELAELDGYEGVAGVLGDPTTRLGTRNDLQSNRSGIAINTRLELGSLVRFREHWSVGFSFRPPSLRVFGDYSASNSLGVRDGSSATVVDDGSFAAPTPMRLALGIGFESSSLDLEVDLFAYPSDGRLLESFGVRESVVIASDGRVTATSQAFAASNASHWVVNASLGARARFGPEWSMVMGFSTDFSALAEPDTLRDLLVATKRDRYHASVGAGYVSPFGDLTAGVRFSYTSGQLLGVSLREPTPAESLTSLREFAALFILYGSIDFGAIGKALVGDEAK